MTEIFTSNTISVLPSWKGETLEQITTSIRLNQRDGTVSERNLFIPQPLKHYRREIASKDQICNPRTSLSIDLLNAPNGSIINSQASDRNGLVNTLDINQTTNKTEIPGSCDAECAVGTPQTNALSRVRSSGMIKKNYDPANNKSKYYTNASQYLNSRSKTFQQNQYNYIREGDSSLTPGSGLSVNNLYSPAGKTDCDKYFLSVDTSFNYEWVSTDNGQIQFTVDVSSGYYDVHDINNLLQNEMINNYHYFLQPDNKSKTTLLNIELNNLTKKVQLTATPIDASTNLLQPVISTELGDQNVDWTVPVSSTAPKIILNDSILTTSFGFTPGTYQTNTSPNVSSYKLRYNMLYYKPNNYQFAQQGAVSSSDLIARRRYNTITDAAASYRTSYGLHVANALAYGVPANGYTVKDKYGYPNKSTPSVGADGVYKECTDTKIRGG
jgi:hypothetical protein